MPCALRGWRGAEVERGFVAGASLCRDLAQGYRLQYLRPRAATDRGRFFVRQVRLEWYRLVPHQQHVNFEHDMAFSVQDIVPPPRIVTPNKAGGYVSLRLLQSYLAPTNQDDRPRADHRAATVRWLWDENRGRRMHRPGEAVCECLVSAHHAKFQRRRERPRIFGICEFGRHGVQPLFPTFNHEHPLD